MVAGINSALNTAKDALLAHLAAINVTGSNISNINTPGYTRLKPVFTPSAVSAVTAGGASQISVKMTDAERVYDKYLDAQIINQEKNIGYTETRQSYLDTIETILNESSGSGISAILGQFWDAWSTLSSNPDGLVERQALIDTSQSLASTISQQAQSLLDVRQDVNENVKSMVEKLNENLTKIADFNGRIATAEFAGGSASDLRDQRATAMREVSKILDVQSYEDNTGQVNIFLPNGKPLVEGGHSWPLDVKVNATNAGYYDVVFSGTTTAINSMITNGGLHALLEMRDTTVAGYIDSLDSLTTRLVNTVNAQHALGYDENGNVGGDFFTITGSPPLIKIESPIASGENTYTGTATSGGTYTGNSAKNYLVEIVTGGALGAATYHVSTDGGSTWGTTQATAAAITLGDGVTMSLTAGTFATGDDFLVKAHSPSKNLELSSSIYADTSKIAASSTVNGDGLNAKYLSALGTNATVMNGNATMGDYYSAFVGRMGQDVASAGSNSEHQAALLTQMEGQREQISGVSLDEEMLNLTKYQTGYAAAARLSSVLNELMDILMKFGE